MNAIKSLFRRAFIPLLAALIVVYPTTDVAAGETILCAHDRPCFSYARQFGNTVQFKFNHVRGWDLYNVRYKTASGVKQVENRSGRFTFNNVKPNHVYRLSVQGCNKRALQRSRCSPWEEASVTAR